jgi:LysR family transcriptional regulator, benzoate and cis,cis-muconate-responsive activator of ben and cat genes
MELRHLRYFVTVAEELSFSRASARLRISQPAVSRQIKDLEDEVGTPLILRLPTGIRLTSAGETFLAYARDILRRSADSLKAMQVFKGGASEAITVAFLSTALPSFLTRALKDFAQENPEVMVNLLELTPSQQIQALRQGQADIALIGNACPELAKEFDLKVVMRIPLAVAVPDDHPLASHKILDLPRFRNDEFVGMNETTFPGRNDLIREVCEAAGFTPRIRWKADSLVSMLALVGSGKGVALVPKDLESLPHDRAVLLPIKNCRAKLECIVATPKNVKPVVQKFLETLSRAVKQRKPSKIR